MGVPGRGFRGQEEDTRMKKTLVLAGWGVLAAALAGAAEIHGSVTDGGKPVAAGVAVRLDCGGTTAAAKTDSFGSYSVKAASGGECTVSVDYKDGSASTKVTVYDKPTKYDFALKQDGDKWTLERK
jgi:hypothetical protein